METAELTATSGVADKSGAVDFEMANRRRQRAAC